MTQDPDSTNSAAFHETFEGGETAADVGETSRRRIKHLADEMAGRANNTTKSYEDTAPDQQVFTK